MVSARASLAAIAVLAGCVDDTTRVTPIIDRPVDDGDATASPLDEITLTIAHAGNDRDLVSQTFKRGEPLAMGGVPFGDDLVIHMAGYIGSSNIAYGRTCAVAVAPDGAPPAPHLFFSRSVKFASLGVVPLPRTRGLGIAYLGSAMFVGGSDGVNPEQMVEMFDPRTGALTTVGAVSARERSVNALVGTSPPRVAVIGGFAGTDGAKFIEVLDGQRIDRLDFTEMARMDLTATSLTDGRVIVIGGNAPGEPPSTDIDEIAQNGASFEVRKLAVQLHTERSGHSATRLGEDVGAPVLIAGGIDATGVPIALAELFKPLSAELADPTTFAPKMQVPRSGHVATLMPDGSVLVIGGVDGNGEPVRTLERFSVDAGFTLAGELPVAAGGIDFAATTLPDGRILLTGGRLSLSAAPSDSAYIVRLNPADGSVDVVATDHLAIARAGHQAVLLCDGTVLISGGIGGQFAAERYNPPPLGRR
jgi:hypothetical protein